MNATTGKIMDRTGWGEYLAAKGFRDFEARYLLPHFDAFLRSGNKHIVGAVRRKQVSGTTERGRLTVTVDLHLAPWGEGQPPVVGKGVLRWSKGRFKGNLATAK